MHDDFTKVLNEAQSRAQFARKALSEFGSLSADPSIESELFVIVPKGTQGQNQSENKLKIQTALAKISPALGRSYSQVNSDLLDKNRKSWAGTAHEIREVLTTLLRTLAPEDDVIKQSWYKQEKDSSGPTQKQRVRFILLQRGAGSKKIEAVAEVSDLDDLIANIVRATYSRASDAAHGLKERQEVIRIVDYFDVFALDLLDLD